MRLTLLYVQKSCTPAPKDGTYYCNCLKNLQEIHKRLANICIFDAVQIKAFACTVHSSTTKEGAAGGTATLVQYLASSLTPLMIICIISFCVMSMLMIISDTFHALAVR